MDCDGRNGCGRCEDKWNEQDSVKKDGTCWVGMKNKWNEQGRGGGGGGWNEYVVG